MRGPIHQTGHILFEVGYFLISLVSRVLNAVFYQGSMHQTLSARTHIEARDAWLTFDEWEAASARKWIARERRIDRLFYVLTFGRQTGHCARAWQSEVTRARKTLARNGDL